MTSRVRLQTRASFGWACERARALGALADLLGRWRIAGDWATHVTSWRTLDAQPPVHGDLPATLHPRLARWLEERQMRLYAHQSEAVELALAGESVVVVTPTASGKTLCYNLPVFDRLLRAPQTRALYLFPTKALAHDQLDELHALQAALGLPPTAAAYDGDTPSGQRVRIRRQAQVLVTNPDMLHAGILPMHTAWREFLARLDYIVIDELHVYRGIFGSHVANVLRRLQRLCRFYGSNPRFICTSATIANPAELAQRLTGAPVRVVARSAAPRGRKELVFYNPPIVDEQLGLRRSALQEARRHANWLLDHDLQTVVFCPSRLMVEQLVIYLREDAPLVGRDPQAIRGYRGGYLARERRQIESELRQGRVRCVVATNALELGVDIGGLTACVLVGYPGSISSTWQRIGRAGRGCDESLALMVASSWPLDQYIVSHPEYFFSQDPERAVINPDNLWVLANHLQCALYELPFDEGERLGEQDPAQVWAALEESGRARAARGRWFWAGTDYPASTVSLRSAENDRVSIVTVGADATRQVIGQVDRDAAPAWVHEGAIYLHEGQQYLVERLDWAAGEAEVRPVQVDYFTEATANLRIRIERERETLARPAAQLHLGDVRLTSRVTGYRKLRLHTLENLGWGTVDLPEHQMVTTALWVTIPDETVTRLDAAGLWVGTRVEARGPDWAFQRDRARQRDGYRCVWCGAEERPGHQHDVHHVRPFREFGYVAGENEAFRQANTLSNLVTLCPSCHRRAEQQVAVQSTLSGLGYVLRHLMPLFLLCEPDDVGVHTELKAPQTDLPTLFVYDNVPGGVGLSDALPSLFDALLARSAELVAGCSCRYGCPSCIGARLADEPRAKQQVLGLMAELRRVAEVV